MKHVRAALVAVVSVWFALAPSASGQYVFAPEATPQEIARLNAAYEAAYGPINPGQRFAITNRWPGTDGLPIVLGFSFAPDGLSIPAPPGVGGSAEDSSLFTVLDQQFLNRGGRTAWQRAVMELRTKNTNPSLVFSSNPGISTCALDRWQNAAAISFNFLRRNGAQTGDDPVVNNFDDGAAWGASGPLNPPGAPFAGLNITLSAPLTSARFQLDAPAGGGRPTNLSLTLNTGVQRNFSLTADATKTIGLLAAAITAFNPALSVTVAGGASASARSVDLVPGQDITTTTGAPNGTLNLAANLLIERGDIRVAMRSLPATVLAFVTPPGPNGGDIILNSTRSFTGGSEFRLLKNIMARAVGQALGLDLVCPSDGTKLMEQVLNLGFEGPQVDDVRGAQRLYGDKVDLGSGAFLAEPNDTAVNAWNFGTAPATTPGQVNLDLSLDRAGDVDLIKFVITGTVVSYDIGVQITPVGGTYNVGPVDTACTGTPLNASAIFDLQGGIFNSTGGAVADGTATGGAAFATYVNAKPAGQTESVHALVRSGGTYFVGVSAANGTAAQSQLYNIQITVVNREFVAGVPTGPITAPFAYVRLPDGSDLTDHSGPTGHGALTYAATFGQTPRTYNTDFLGSRARFANVEGSFPDDRHVAFGGRTIQLFRWAGVNPASDTKDSHPTECTGAATGTTVPLGTSFFRGVAPEAPLFAGNISMGYTAFGSYILSPEALYFSLFGLADPLLVAQAGLDMPVTVISSSWGGLGDFRGDGFIAQTYDAVTDMTGVTCVVAAGNDGEFDNTSTCNRDGGNIPGGLFVGSRTVSSPGTAFNVLTVGAVGRGYGGFPPGGGITQPPGGGGRPAGSDGAAGAGSGGTRGVAEDPNAPPAAEAIPGTPLSTVVNFSSKGPVDSFNFNTNNLGVQNNVRPGVHILATGSGLVKRAPDPATLENAPDPCLAYFPGHEGTAGIALPVPNVASDAVFEPGQGTSFATPMVAGAVALLQDYGLSQLPPVATDSRVMRSILMTSAVKLAGWSNNGNPAKPQDNRDGRAYTQLGTIIANETGPAGRLPLDAAQGAGVLAIPYAFSIYALGDLTDSPLTDPTKPTQTQADELPPPQGGNRSSQGADRNPNWTAQELDQLRQLLPHDEPMSPVEFLRVMTDVRGIDRDIVFRPMRPDFNDPNLTPGQGKNGAGDFDPRTPFLGGGTVPPRFGTNAPTPVKPIVLPVQVIEGGQMGWDYANLGIKSLRLRSGTVIGGFMDYHITIPQVAITPPDQVILDPNGIVVSGGIPTSNFLTATLTWNRSVAVQRPNFALLDNPGVGSLSALALEDLDLELYDGGTGFIQDGQEPLASSRSTLSNIEHIHYELGYPGSYILRVAYKKQDYNVFGNIARGGVKFCVSWAWRHELDRKMREFQLPLPAARGLAAGLPLLVEVLRSYGAHLGDPNYSRLADVVTDNVVDTKDLLWVIARMPAPNQNDANQ